VKVQDVDKCQNSMELATPKTSKFHSQILFQRVSSHWRNWPFITIMFPFQSKPSKAYSAVPERDSCEDTTPEHSSPLISRNSSTRILILSFAFLVAFLALVTIASILLNIWLLTQKTAYSNPTSPIPICELSESLFLRPYHFTISNRY
jgi:hypothetical protein